MKKIICSALVGLFLLGGTAAGGQSPGLEMSTHRDRYVVGRVATLTLRNSGSSAVSLNGPWTITDVRAEKQVSHYDFSDEELTLEPGEEVVWEWPQDDACYGICRNVREGQPVGPGVYRSSVESSEGTLTTRFQTGQFFTIDFTCGEGEGCTPVKEFTVYVNTPEEVSQMETEAQASEKTLIVSGIVRKKMRYNADWKISMGPGSIVLGEVFIEVCDGSATYVQRHREEWYGERWCPWSSYVKRVGR
jgi:hypothetical protein